MIKYCDKGFKLVHKRPRTGRLSIVDFPVSICCQIARRICSYAFIPPGFSGEKDGTSRVKY